MNKKGILVVLSGFSGAGKGTIMKELIQQYPEHYALSVSATTRAPRFNEVHGREYYFISKEEFESMIEQEALIEHAQYVGNYYGTPCDYVNQQLNLGKDVILEIETQGGHKVKKRFPDTLLLFVTPPSARELYNRLENRNTETEEVIRGRLAQAIIECDSMSDYDFLIINDELKEAVNQVHEIIQNEHYRISRNNTIINAMKTELELFSKGE